MKQCDILAGSKRTLTPPTYFSGDSRLQPSKIYAPEHAHAAEWPLAAAGWANFRGNSLQARRANL